MEIFFAIAGSIFISISTIGFLLIQTFLDSDIVVLKNRNKRIIQKQREIMDWVLKADTYIEQANTQKAYLEIMKKIEVKDEIINITKKIYKEYIKRSVIYSINALIVSKKIDDEEAGIKLGEVDKRSMNELILMKNQNLNDAALATNQMNADLNDNKRKIEKAEKNKSLFWNICFSSQLFGLVLGLLSISYSSVE